MVVKTPFFNNPVNPGGVSGEPFSVLWNYESITFVFFYQLINVKQLRCLIFFYQSTVLFLNGIHNTMRHSLPLHFTTSSRSADDQLRQNIIPLKYLPPRLTKMNTYSIYGPDSRRVYEALYPIPNGLFPNPDLYSSISILLNCCALFH